MIFAVFLALFLPCVGMGIVFVVYMCFLCYATTTRRQQQQQQQPNNIHEETTKGVKEKGLSSTQLDKLPKVSGQELVMGNDCAVCLDEIEKEQVARLIPGCNHGFHIECADTWLSKQPVCPVCRCKLETELFDTTIENNPC